MPTPPSASREYRGSSAAPTLQGEAPQFEDYFINDRITLIHGGSSPSPVSRLTRRAGKFDWRLRFAANESSSSSVIGCLCKVMIGRSPMSA